MSASHKRIKENVLTGEWKALALLAVPFLLGGLFGCLLAGKTAGNGSQSLMEYLQSYLDLLRSGAAGTPGLLDTVWGIVRFPLCAVLLGFTVLGILGLPILFALRGFLLSFAIASFARMFGTEGVFLAFLLFGITGVIEIPAFFILGVQSATMSVRQLERKKSGGHRILGCDRHYFLCLIICAVALVICILLEYCFLPSILGWAADTIQ